MQIGGMGAMPNPAMMQQKMMSRFDTDKSGGINLQEFSSMRDAVSARRPDAPIASGSAEELFNRIDADASGELSSSELQAYRKAHMPPAGGMPSAGGMLGSDMMSSLLQCQCVDEGGGFGGPRQHMLSRFDNDENGELNLEEFSSMREAVSARRPEAPIASGNLEEVFSQIDEDASGELSSSELRAFRMANRPSEGGVDGPRHRMMSRFDNDQNGELNIEEFSSMREAIMARHPNTPIASGNIEELFRLIDEDASGELSLSELEAFKLSNDQSEGA